MVELQKCATKRALHPAEKLILTANKFILTFLHFSLSYKYIFSTLFFSFLFLFFRREASWKLTLSLTHSVNDFIKLVIWICLQSFWKIHISLDFRARKKLKTVLESIFWKLFNFYNFNTTTHRFSAVTPLNNGKLS